MKYESTTKKRLQQFQEWFIEQQITVQQQIEIPNSIQLLIYSLGLFQSVTFLITPTRNLMRNGEVPSFDNFFGIIYISRLDFSVLSFESQTEYLYFIPFCIMIICDIFPQIYQYFQERFKGISKQDEINVTFPQRIASIYSQIFSQYFFIPFSMFCFESIDKDLNNIPEFLFQLFMIACLFITLVLKFSLQLETIDLKVVPLQQLNSTILDFFRCAILILQITTFALITDEKTGILIQSMLVIFVSLIQISTIFSLCCCNLTKIKIKLMISCFGIVYAVATMLSVEYTYINQLRGSILVIVSPLLLALLMKAYWIFDDSLLQNIHKEQRFPQLKYYFAKLFNQEFQSQEQYNIALSRVLVHTLKQQSPAQDVDICKCNFNSIMPQTYVNRFHGKLLKRIRHSIQNMSKQNKVNYVIHYMAILYRLGQIQLAFQQVSNIINKGSKMNSRISSQQKEFPQMSLTGKSISFNPDKSMSKDSKSQELNDMRNKQILKSQSYIINVSQNISLLSRVKIQILKNKIKRQMQSQFIFKNQSSDTTNIKLSVLMFLECEQQNQNLRQSVLNLLSSKLQLYLSLSQSKIIRSQNLYTTALKLAYRMDRIEEKLAKLYESFPSQKIQSIASYYQGEVINNILEAYRYASTSSLSEEKLFNVHRNINTSLFSKNLVYMNILLDDQSQQLTIIGASEQAYKLFQCEPEQLKAQNTIDFLIPDAIRSEHQLLVSKFLQTGSSKFYLNNQRNFCKIDGIIIKPISFFFDISLNFRNEVQFFAFFEELIQHSSFMIVDVNGSIGGVTEDFFNKVGTQIMNLEVVPTQYIFPDIREFPKYIDQQSFYCKMYFIDSSYQGRATDKQVWTNIDCLNEFDVQLGVELNDFFGYFYLILQLKDIKKSSKTIMNIEDYFEISQLTETEGQVHEPEINEQPKFRNVDLSDNCKFISFDQMLIQQIDQDIPQVEDDKNQYELHILSPNQSFNPLFSAKQSMKMIQQDYYDSSLKDASYSFQKSQIENKMLQLESLEKQKEMIDIDQEKRSQKKKDSDATSFAGIKKAQFYKKYEIVSKILSISFPNNLKLFLLSMALEFLITTIFAIIILTEGNSDLSRFIKEIDMIALHATFMAPHDICLGTRITVVSYEMYMNMGVINRTKFLELSNPLFENQDFGYYEMKDNFYSDMQNPSLQMFFKDRNITVVVMNKDATSVYTMDLNIREALYMMLQYYYQFKLRFEAKLSPANQTYQVFQFANVLNFHYWMEELTMEIYYYSKDRSQTIKNKWFLVWGIFLSLSFIIILASALYFFQFQQKYDKYMNLFRYCQSSKLNRDIDRYKLMIKLLTNNADAIFHYKFDLDQKESLLQLEKPKFQLEWRNGKEVKAQGQQIDPLSKGFRIFLILFVWLLFGVFSTVSNTETSNYLTKYTQTTDLYKLIQDMTYSTGSLFQLRNFKLLWNNFTYLTELDNERIYESIYFGLDNIDKFHTLYLDFNVDLYLVTDYFYNYFDKIENSNVCDMVGEEQLQFLMQYCNKSLEGTLTTGLQTTLNFIKHTIQTQMAVNNFTKRTDFSYYESEGGLIVIKAFQEMTKILKYDIVNKTKQSQDLSNYLAISYIILITLIVLLLLMQFRKSLIKEFNIVKKFIQLIPTPILFFDDQFERNIRILILSQDQ